MIYRYYYIRLQIYIYIYYLGSDRYKMKLNRTRNKFDTSLLLLSMASSYTKRLFCHHVLSILVATLGRRWGCCNVTRLERTIS